LSIVLPLSAGLIFVWLLIWLSRKRDKRLDKEEKWFVIKITIITIIATLVPVVFFGYFQLLQYYGISPPNLTFLFEPLIYIISGSCFAFIFWSIYKKRKKLSESILNKTLLKLNWKIQRELEEEAKEKCWLAIQKRLEIIPWMATVLARDIWQGLPPNNYEVSVGGVMGRTDQHYTMVDKYGFAIPIDEGKGLAEKMSQISRNKKYRRNKLLFLMLP
jgi:hypothetical protein